MKELIDQLKAKLGVSGAQAEGGAAVLFKAARDKLGAGEFDQLLGGIPGLGDLMKNAPAAPGGISAPDFTGAHAARKVVVPLASDRTAPRCSAAAAVVCLLQRGCSSPSLERLTPGEVADALSHAVAPGFDRYPERHAGVVRALATTGGWRLTLSNDPDEALPLLRRLRPLDRRPAPWQPLPFEPLRRDAR